MIIRTALHTILMAGLTSFIGCSENDPKAVRPMPESPAPKGVGEFVLHGTMTAELALTIPHETPDDVFTELQNALGKTDYQRAARTLTPKAQTAIAGALLFELGLAMANDDQQADRIDQLLAKFVAQEGESPPADETTNAAGTLRAMGSRVRHSAGFIAAALKILLDSPVKQLMPQGELHDVEIDKTSAKGVVTQLLTAKPPAETVATEAPVAAGDETQEQSATSSGPVEFQMIEGGWRVHLPDQVFEEIED